MAFVNFNIPKMFNKDISKSSDKIELSTKENLISSSDDQLKYQQDQLLNSNIKPSLSKVCLINDNQSQITQLTKHANNSSYASVNFDTLLDNSSPVVYNIMSKKARNRLNFKSITAYKPHFNQNSSSIEISSSNPSKRNAIGNKENLCSLIKLDENKNNNSKQENSDANLFKRVINKTKERNKEVNNNDTQLVSSHSATIQIINDKIKPVVHIKNSNQSSKLNNNHSKADNKYKIIQQENKEKEEVNMNYYQKPNFQQIELVIMKKPKHNHDYFDNNYNHKKTFKPECFQFFGSNETRQLILNTKDKEITPGPGSYFNSHIDESKPIGRIMKQSFERDLLEKLLFPINSEANKKTNKVGPGSYNFKSTILKRSCSNVDNFGSCEKRFIQHFDMNNPGPGSYDVNYNQNKVSSYKEKNSIVLQNKIEQQTQKYIKEHYNIQQPYPAIGQYYSEQFNSIDHKVKTKRKTNAPFSSIAQRFDNNTLNNNKIEYYGKDYFDIPSDFDKIKEVKNQGGVPFLFSQGRDLNNGNRINNKPYPMPGQLRKDSFFDWNKKSFNIKYL